MKDLRPIKGKYYIHKLIDEGEHEHQDFKYAISDARKIARSISAFANNDGGRLLVGVKDNGIIAGIPDEEDIYMIETAAQLYCDPPVEVRMDTFAVENGLIVLRAEILKGDNRPVYCLEEKGRRVAYYRVKDENIVAHPLMIRTWLRRQQMTSAAFYDERSRAVLAWIDGHGASDARAVSLGLHISMAATEEILVELAAMGMIEFVYAGGTFLFTVPQEEWCDDVP